MKNPNIASLIKALGLGALALSLPAIASAQNETKTDAPMLTPWAADAQAGRGWQEYPRPQMTRATWQNLNGQWDYAITPLAAAAPAKYDGKIRVPYPVESVLSGVARELKPGQRLWYHRAFTIPKAWDGQRVLLHFGAVDWEAHVYVNGAPVGSHRGGFDPFSFDITPYIKAGGGQELVVAVTDPTSEGDQPRGKQKLDQQGIWYTPASGIWQTVWLEPVPAEMSIAVVKCEPNLDAGLLKLTTLGNRVAVGKTHYAIRARVLDGGKLVAEAGGRLNRELNIPIPDAKTWSPDSPHLYDLQIDLFRVENPFKGEKINPKTWQSVRYFGPEEQAFYAKLPDGAVQLDSVKSYFGMRKISLGQGPKGVVMMLNNKPLFHYGPLDQGYWPDGLLTPPTEAAMRFDLDYLKKAGFNMLRKHIKVEPALYYAHCDRIGLLVWQDMPSGMAEGASRTPGEDSQFVRRGGQKEAVRSPGSARQFETELRAMIDALYSHPSIVVWVPMNEGWGQYDSVRLGAAVKACDPSRLVNNVSGWLDTGAGDMLDYHNYSEKMPVMERKDAHRALVLGEFGGLGYPIEGHLWWTNKRNWGYQTYHNAADLEKHYIDRLSQLREFAENQGMCAGVYTQTTDVEGEVNGLLTYDRKVEKIPAARLKEIHQATKLY
ncbi:hypothetical protein M2447_000235 [Ereboglobus sp. PH5-10]|uniref:glycoside hydrolase family 2 protein n=1 Tax=Ereboglobus sp. PH5-10 TaxID=2940629 RepID=UPI002404A3EF|nr:sugar-binding domain-containing protein [Ereboglobus sp. PH5-10]MDF9826159.1 hypothetical protein [Ereboglobus sp. PH5-10]